MAAKYSYCIVATCTLLTLNILFLPVDTETILGEVVDDEFDFDGVPGVEHKVKVEVPAGREECFYQFVPENGRLFVNFEVLRGGDRMINFFLINPENDIIESQYGVTDGRSDPGAIMKGHYGMCYDNTQARFGSKLVSFSLATIVMDKWIEYMADVSELQGLAVNFSTILGGVQFSLITVETYQFQTISNIMRDWYSVASNNKYIGYWSTGLCVFVMCAGVGQVYFLRRLFRMPSVTPTSKPRA